MNKGGLDMKRFSFLFLLGLALVFNTKYLNAAQRPFELTILHINDHHSHLDPEPLELTANGKTYIIEAGGMARVASLIKTLKSRSKNSLVLHAGDAMSGTLYFTLFKGQADVELMNEMGFDAFTLGNHEFDEGDEVLARFIDKAKFPIITANVEALEGSVLYNKWKPYIIKEIDGHKVGIIGLETAQKTSASSRPSSAISFYDEIFRTQRYADELHSKGIDKIILLSHFGYENGRRLAQKVKGIDVIIDGDSHSLLGDFSAVGLASSGQYPTKVRSLDGNEVCIVQAWEYSKVVGELHVVFDNKGNIASCSGKSHLISGEDIYLKDAKGQKKQADQKSLYALRDILKNDAALAMVKDDKKVAQKLSVYTGLVESIFQHCRICKCGPDQTHVCWTVAAMAATPPANQAMALEPGHGFSGPNSANVLSPNSPTSSVIRVIIGTYIFQWTIANGNCTPSSDQVQVVINSLPSLADAGPDQTGTSTCGLTTVTLAANTPTVGTGQWSILSGTGGSFGNINSPTSTFSGVSGTAYILRWTISFESCTSYTDDHSGDF